MQILGSTGNQLLTDSSVTTSNDINLPTEVDGLVPISNDILETIEMGQVDSTANKGSLQHLYCMIGPILQTCYSGWMQR